MRALLAVADVLVLRNTYQNTVVILGRKRKQFHSTHRYFSQPGYRLPRKGWRFVKQRSKQNPEIADKHSKTCQHQELGQLSASDVAFVCGANGEFFLPQWFATRSAQPVHAFSPTYNRSRPKRSRPVRREPS